MRLRYTVLSTTSCCSSWPPASVACLQHRWQLGLLKRQYNVSLIVTGITINHSLPPTHPSRARQCRIAWFGVQKHKSIASASSLTSPCFLAPTSYLLLPNSYLLPPLSYFLPCSTTPIPSLLPPTSYFLSPISYLLTHPAIVATRTEYVVTSFCLSSRQNAILITRNAIGQC